MKVKDKNMKKLKIGTNFTVFILFFGVALIEAFQKGSWLEALLFSALGIMFLFSDEKNN